MPPRVVLVGAPGAGKTVVGSLLAQRWHIDLLETDAQVEATAGATISDIYVDEGEAGFRRRESDALRTVLATDDVVAVIGGGVVEDTANRERLAGLAPGTLVVHLAVGANESGKRMGITGIRPVGLGNVRSQWNAMMNRRRPLYEQVATVTVVTDNRSPQDVADDVAAIVEEQT